MRDPIKGLKLRRFDAYLGGAAVGEGEKESLIYCGSYIYEGSVAAVDEPQ